MRERSGSPRHTALDAQVEGYIARFGHPVLVRTVVVALLIIISAGAIAGAVHLLRTAETDSRALAVVLLTGVGVGTVMNGYVAVQVLRRALHERRTASPTL
jgi:preprotein translocase subunit SecF